MCKTLLKNNALKYHKNSNEKENLILSFASRWRAGRRAHFPSPAQLRTYARVYWPCGYVSFEKKTKLNSRYLIEVAIQNMRFNQIAMNIMIKKPAMTIILNY